MASLVRRDGDDYAASNVRGGHTMTDKPAPPPPPDEPILDKVRAALGDMFAATIAGLEKDLQGLLAQQGGAPSGKAVEKFTEDMIKLLAERVKSVLPNPPR